MTKIFFENENSKNGTWTWHYGTYNEQYPFSICEMYEPLNDTSSFEITWIEETPENSSEIESEILNELEKKFRENCIIDIMKSDEKDGLYNY
jgi:hypothetical protein